MVSQALTSTYLGTQQVLSGSPGHLRKAYIFCLLVSPALAFMSSPPGHSHWLWPRCFHPTFKGPSGEDAQVQLPLMGCRPRWRALKWSDQTPLGLVLGWASVEEALRRRGLPAGALRSGEWRGDGQGADPAKVPIHFPSS